MATNNNIQPTTYVNPYNYYPQTNPYMVQQTYAPANQPNAYSQVQQMQNNPQQQNVQTVLSDRIWVQGENAAKAYLVAKNSEQVIWDSEQPSIYIKTVDVYGKPTMVTLDYTIRPIENSNSGVANSEVTDLKNEVGDLKSGLNDLKGMFEDFIKAQQSQQKTYKPNYNKGGNNQ